MRTKNIDLIKEHEGLVLKAYLPTPNDKWTIGYGHIKGVKPGDVITEEQAELLLREDLDWVEEWRWRKFPSLDIKLLAYP